MWTQSCWDQGHDTAHAQNIGILIQLIHQTPAGRYIRWGGHKLLYSKKKVVPLLTSFEQPLVNIDIFIDTFC